jgi:Tfp pilus assembly protein PilO
MNLTKLPKEKQKKLALVILLTLIGAAGLYFGLLRNQQESLTRLAREKAAKSKQLQDVVQTVRRAEPIREEFEQARKTLEAAETDIAFGDHYAWVMNSLRQFKAPHKVEIPQFSQLGPIVDVNLFPNFPYKQATLTVAGTARYHDLGHFLADFENEFPHVRILNLSLDANLPSLTSEPETLSFKMDVACLIKPNPS